jgi:hypothetical protein
MPAGAGDGELKVRWRGGRGVRGCELKRGRDESGDAFARLGGGEDEEILE